MIDSHVISWMAFPADVFILKSTMNRDYLLLMKKQKNNKYQNVYIHFTAHKTSLCKPSRYKNISFMHFSLIFHPTSLNSKNLTIDSGLNVSNITFKLEMTVADVRAMANVKIIAKIHFFLNIIVTICV